MKLQDRISDYEPRYRATKKFGKLIRHNTWKEYRWRDIWYNICITRMNKSDF